jgi:iron complex transport system substrate-binding protein
MKFRIITTNILIVLLFISCENYNNKIKNNTPEHELKKEITIRYSKGFSIKYYKDYKIITTFNPWKNNEILYQYYIYYNNTPIHFKNNILKMPIINDKIIALSASQLGFIDALKLTNNLIAVSKKEYIYNPNLIENIDKKKFLELGDESNLNYEALFNLKPEIVFATGWNNTNPSFNKIINAKIPVIFLFEWQENTPLGRAEWIKFIAAFFNKEEKADSIFKIIEKNYNKIKNTTYSNTPTVLHGSLINGTWYIPGGNSYISNMYKDAGAKYLWGNTKETGSLPLKFESVFSKAKDADYWFPMINISSTNELLNTENRYSLFNTIENKNIYLANKKQNIFNGNDYWESGVVYPDKVLGDLVKILHDKNPKNNELIYFTSIK